MCDASFLDGLVALIEFLAGVAVAACIPGLFALIDGYRDRKALRRTAPERSAMAAWRVQADLAHMLQRHAAEYEAHRREVAYQAALAYVRG